MFNKNPTIIPDQIDILKSRGLIIESVAGVSHYLSHISCYRLGEYWHSAQDDAHLKTE